MNDGGGETCSPPAIRGEVSPLRTQGGVQDRSDPSKTVR